RTSCRARAGRLPPGTSSTSAARRGTGGRAATLRRSDARASTAKRPWRKMRRSHAAPQDRDPGQGDPMTISLKVNGVIVSVPAEPDTPLLYVLRNDLALNGAKFGCGLLQCNTCTVLVDGQAVRSCVTPIGALGQSKITTIEGLGTVQKP